MLTRMPVQCANDLTIEIIRVNPYSSRNPLQPRETIVSNTAHPSLRLKPFNSAALDLLRDLFKATPLYIFATALTDARTQQR